MKAVQFNLKDVILEIDKDLDTVAQNNLTDTHMAIWVSNQNPC